MGERRPHIWEKSYPAGVRWDTPIAVTTLPELLHQAVQTYATKPALEFQGRRLTYSELGEAVANFAAGLIDAGLRLQETVALYLPNCPTHPVSFFGVLKAGGRLVHLSPLDGERELLHKLADSGARTIVTTDFGPLLERALKLLARGAADRVLVGEDATFGPANLGAQPLPKDDPRLMRISDIAARAAAGRARDWPAVSPDDIALLQYTGGTTGVPKAAMLSHANLSAAISIHNAWGDPQGLSLRGEGRTICVLPLFHIYALTSCLTRALHLGHEILLRPRFDVATTLDDIETKRATFFPGVPTMWIAIAHHPGLEGRDLSSLVTISSGGAPCPIEIETRIQQLTGRRLGGGWGMTETSPAGSNIPRNRPDKRGTIGVPLPGIVMDVVALDDPHRVLPIGEAGEIRVKGPNVTRGYWNRPDETAQSFVDGFLLTGDIGYIDDEGFFFIVDRKKDMILSGGFNVYPRAIEEAIYEHPSVEEVIVIGVADAYRGEAAKAFVKLKAGTEPFALEDLRDFLADKLGRHELPAHLEFRGTLPKTAVGKLSKKELVDEERQRAKIAAPQP
ncbi:MAG: dicarboxylate--CoA ligase PimA [Rhodospirillales bacterium]|nr:dicarboxylate--CoA ligase PimA [Rhodospirillales bacterium]